jgi:hypothetical protein
MPIRGLLADVVYLVSVAKYKCKAAVPIGTYEFFPQLVRLVANERHRQSHP